MRIACRLKEAGEVIQLDKLAFCLAHPALHRKLNFALRLEHAGWIGGSIDVPLDQRGDIYIDAADSTAMGVWLNPMKAQAWVLAQLKGQGIVMRAGLAASGVQRGMAVSRSAFLIAPLFFVACATQEPPPDVPSLPAPVTTESQVVGCYEEARPEQPSRHVAPWGTPSRFYLTDRLQGLAPLNVGTVALRWVIQADYYRASGHWRLTGPNTIQIVWTTGFQGVSVALRRGSVDEMWRGGTRPFSDDGRAVPGVEMSARRVRDEDCDFLR